MKNIRLFTFVLTIATLVLGACSAAEVTPAAPKAATSAKAIAMPVTFIGIVDSMAGDQWVISGTTVTVDESIVRDGPFNVGDRVKVEGFANSDGTLTLSRVESPTPRETATLPPLTDDNSNDSAINANANTNEAGGNANTNDDNSNAVNSNDDNSNSANTNDDNGSSVNSNDDHGNDDNSNSANTNDDNGNDDNSNDDNGGNSNSDDSNGNDDNSGSGSDDNSNGG